MRRGQPAEEPARVPEPGQSEGHHEGRPCLQANTLSQRDPRPVHAPGGALRDGAVDQGRVRAEADRRVQRRRARATPCSTWPAAPASSCARSRAWPATPPASTSPRPCSIARALHRRPAGTDQRHAGARATCCRCRGPTPRSSIVTSRFAFHHFLEPGAVLREMERVCRPGGRVMVVDSAPAPDKADAFNRMEVVRDPSHARALPLSRAPGPLPHRRPARAARDVTTGWRASWRASIARSFPKPGDDDDAAPDLRRLAARRRAGHPGASRRRHDPLRLSGGGAGRSPRRRTAMRIVDLIFPIRPHFRWKVEPELRNSHARGDIFQSTILTIACHAYTHVDAPLHFLPGDRDIASMPVDQWIGDGRRRRSHAPGRQRRGQRRRARASRRPRAGAATSCCCAPTGPKQGRRGQGEVLEGRAVHRRAARATGWWRAG